jgi:hypothetical protein
MITTRHTTLGRTPLDELSARRIDLYLIIHNSHKRQTTMPRWNLNPQALHADPRFRPRVHWDRLLILIKVKVIPQQAKVAQGAPGRLRHRIFVTFGTTRVVGRQPYAQAAFTPREIPGTHFQRLGRTQGTWFRWKPWKNKPVTPSGIDPGTSRLVAQCLNHYATPNP